MKIKSKEKHYAMSSGKVADLHKANASVNLLRSSTEAGLAEWSAVAQALLNLPGAISSAELASVGGNPVEVFSMSVDGRKIAGYFWQAAFEDGDDVEVVGPLRDGVLDAVAVRRTRDRVIWLRPYHLMGSRALRRADFRRLAMYWLATYPIAFALFPGMALLTSTGNEPWAAILIGTLAICVATNIACAFLLRTPRQLDFGREVDAVGRAFGMSLPEVLDFKKTHDAALAAGKRAVGGAYFY